MTDAATAADLMFRPASELAALVRAGELSARELVEASLERIEALEPGLNAFVDVYAERGAGRRRRDRARRRRGRSPACRSRSRTTAPSTGKR